MPIRRPVPVVHLEGRVLDQPSQRGRYGVRAVLYRVGSMGRREEIWDYYGTEWMAMSRALDTEASRRINGEDCHERQIVIYDRVWSDGQVRRVVNAQAQGSDPQPGLSALDRLRRMTGGRVSSVPRADDYHNGPAASWADAVDTWMGREQFVNPPRYVTPQDVSHRLHPLNELYANWTEEDRERPDQG